MTKFVCISDIHNQFDRITVPPADVLIIAGDISSSGKPYELEAFNDWVKHLPHQHKILIAGNHDLWFERFPNLARELVPDVTYLENSSVTIEGIEIWGSPVTPRFFNWAFMMDSPQRERLWKTIPATTDIVITHGPPHGILDKTLEGDNVGCRALAKRLRHIKPAYHIFGHIHEGYGRSTIDGTTYLNVSTCNRRYDPINPPVSFEIK